MIICFVTLSVTDLQTADILIDTSSEDQSSSWAWVSDDMKKGSSGIDNEDYEIVNEESVEDAFADFIAKSVLSNPNAQVYIYITYPKYIASPSLLERKISCHLTLSLFINLQKLAPEELNKSKFYR